MNKKQNSQLDSGSIIGKAWGALTTALFDIVCVLCFFYAARYMFEDVYKCGLWEDEFVVRMILMVFIVSLLSEMAESYGRAVRICTRLGILAAGFLWLYRYLKSGRNVILRLTSGFYKIAALYIDGWNDYYGTDFGMVDTGSFTYVSDSLDITMLVLFFLFLVLAKMCRKNMVLAMIPNAVFVAIVLSGKAPGGVGIFLMLAGVLLVNSRGFKKTDFIPAGGRIDTAFLCRSAFAWLRCGVITAVIFFAIATTQDGLAEDVVDKYSGNAKRLTAVTVENTIKKISELESVRDIELSGAFGEMVNSYAADVDADMEQLNNSTPVYKNEPVLEVAVYEKPLADMYLKNFTAIHYDNGTWLRDKKGFEKACINAGFDAKHVSDGIAALVVNKLKDIKGVESIKDISAGNYGSITDLTYTTAVSLPFAAEIGNASAVVTEGDGWFSKEAATKTVLFNQWNYKGEYEELAILQDAAKKDWEVWYENYVLEQYLTVPEDMPNLEKLSEELLEDAGRWTEYIEPVGESELRFHNVVRLQNVEAVIKWLQNNTRYSINLEELPEGADPVEYFLGTSRMGYCMHYASAATLLLRKMGVPARYVSGFIAERATFKSMYSGYKSTVNDNKAHAWVEIYLEGIGWIPVEVTNSYSDRREEVPDGPVTEPTTEPVTEPDVPENPPEEQEKPVTPTDSQESDGDNDDGSNPSDPKKDSDDEKDDESEENKSYWVIIIIGIPVVFIAGLYSCFKLPFIRERIEKAEWEKLRRQEPGKAIRTMNRRLYYKLCLSGKSPLGNIQDDLYEQTLKKRYPKIDEAYWSRYMELVKAAVFSKRKMTEEEMTFCYEIYRQI